MAAEGTCPRQPHVNVIPPHFGWVAGQAGGCCSIIQTTPQTIRISPQQISGSRSRHSRSTPFLLERLSAHSAPRSTNPPRRPFSSTDATCILQLLRTDEIFPHVVCTSNMEMFEFRSTELEKYLISDSFLCRPGQRDPLLPYSNRTENRRGEVVGRYEWQNECCSTCRCRSGQTTTPFTDHSFLRQKRRQRSIYMLVSRRVETSRPQGVATNKIQINPVGLAQPTPA